MKLSAFKQVFKTSLQEEVEYRQYLLVVLLVAMFALASAYFLWSGIFADKAELMGYTKEKMITYYVLMAFLVTTFFQQGTNISYHIQTGFLSMYLVRPFHYLWYQYAKFLGRTFLSLIIGLPLFIGFFLIFHESLVIISDPIAYVNLIVSLVLALHIIFFLDLLITFIEFWVYGSESIDMVFGIIRYFFAGAFIPLVFLPEIFQTIAEYLPFKYIGAFVVDSFFGNLSQSEINTGFVISIFWIFVLFVLAMFIWRIGLKKYEAYGS